MLKTYRKTFLSLSLFLISQPAFSILCPNNFNSISLGDTLQSVIQTCGAPISRSNYVKNNYASQEWVYYVTENFNQGTSTLSVVFNNDHVVNISLTGNYRACEQPTGDYSSSQNNSGKCIPVTTQRTRSLSSTNVCSGGVISLGSTVQNVEAACGAPVFNNHDQDPTSQKSTTVLTYSGPPVTRLVFEDGVLTDRVQGN